MVSSDRAHNLVLNTCTVRGKSYFKIIGIIRYIGYPIATFADGKVIGIKLDEFDIYQQVIF